MLKLFYLKRRVRMEEDMKEKDNRQFVEVL